MENPLGRRFAPGRSGAGSAPGMTAALLLQRAGARVTIYANATGYGSRALFNDQSLAPDPR
jgi:2-polyprenyl-6-methoxyphenol hydroxylase-like FAD-dependent oxidoreductase